MSSVPVAPSSITQRWSATIASIAAYTGEAFSLPALIALSATRVSSEGVVAHFRGERLDVAHLVDRGVEIAHRDEVARPRGVPLDGAEVERMARHRRRAGPTPSALVHRVISASGGPHRCGRAMSMSHANPQ